MRPDDRTASQLRPLKIKRHFTKAVPGSVLIQAGRTTVLCSAMIENNVPAWLIGKGRGWLTSEYSMLPSSTNPRKKRDRGANLDGRTTEIQRLIGRSLRAVVDLEALGERTLMIDCDVLEADGGTRTLSITGAFIALVDALAATKDLPDPRGRVLRQSVAAISVGIVDNKPVLDLCYEEDVAAGVDMNVVMTGDGRFVEVQGTGEEATFTGEQLDAMLALAKRGIDELTEFQKKTLGRAWTFGTV
jgi:ribonuclease PH